MRTSRLLVLGSALFLPAGGFAAACGSSSNGAKSTDASTSPDVRTGYDAGSADAMQPADAASPDAGGNDGAVNMSPSCTGLAYCDDFETYEAGAITNNEMLGPWAASVADLTVMVDAVNPYESKQSLHIMVPAGPSSHGTLTQAKTTGLIAGNNMFGRAMVYYSDATGNGLPLGVHSWLFNSSGDSTVDHGGPVTMNMGGGGDKLQLNYHPPPDAGEQSIQGGMISAGMWHCIQWQYDGSGSPPANVANVWIDGTLAVNAPVTKGWQFATPWTSFNFGFTHYQTLDANTVEVFLDDFALGAAMVACP